jgi:hypothetical protein
VLDPVMGELGWCSEGQEESGAGTFQPSPFAPQRSLLWGSCKGAIAAVAVDGKVTFTGHCVSGR